jgi:hypothetical protein
MGKYSEFYFQFKRTCQYSKISALWPFPVDDILTMTALLDQLSGACQAAQLFNHHHCFMGTRHTTPDTKRLIALISETLTPKEITQATHISERTVHRILSPRRRGIPLTKLATAAQSQTE